MRHLALICMLLFSIACSPEPPEKKSTFIAGATTKTDSLTPVKATHNPVKSKPEFQAPRGIYKDNPPKKTIYAVISTNLGRMKFELFPQHTPIATESFVQLAKAGFYNNNNFFRLVPNFIIQTGDRTNTGYADAGYYFDSEFSFDLSHDRPGMLSFANQDIHTNSSQFFITLSSQPQLDKRHPIFGMIVSGKDVLTKFNQIATDSQERPEQAIFIQTVTILD